MDGTELIQSLVRKTFPTLPFRFEPLAALPGWTRAVAMDFSVSFGPESRWLDVRAQLERRLTTMGQDAFVCDACQETVRPAPAEGDAAERAPEIPRARIECKLCTACVCSTCYLDRLWACQGVMTCEWCGDRSGKPMRPAELQVAEQQILASLLRGNEK